MSKKQNSGNKRDSDEHFQDILKSYHSQNEEDSEEKEKMVKKQDEKCKEEGDSFCFDIRDSVHIEDQVIRFGDEGKLHKEHSFNRKSTNSQSKIKNNSKAVFSSEISDFHNEDDSEGDTNQIIIKSQHKNTQNNYPSISNHYDKQISSDQYSWEDTEEIEVKNVKKSKIKTEKQAEQSGNSKSKIKAEKAKEVQKGNTSGNKKDQQDNQVIDIGRSLYTERLDKPKQNRKNIAKKQEKKQQICINKGAQKSPQRQFQEKEREHLRKIIGQQEIINASQSFYLTSSKQTKQKKTKEIQLKIMGKRMYWEDISGQLELTFEVIQMLMEEFLKIDIFLPLIEQSQLENQFAVHLMKNYTQFLTSIYGKQFKKNLTKIKESMALSNSQSGMMKSSSSKSLVQNSSSNSFAGVFKLIHTKFLGNKRYSKVELVRNYLIDKLNSLRVASQIIGGIDEYHEKQLNRMKEDIGSLQLLVCLQNSENYCKSKSKQELEQKIWKDRGVKIAEKRKQWIKKLQKQDFGEFAIFKI